MVGPYERRASTRDLEPTVAGVRHYMPVRFPDEEQKRKAVNVLFDTQGDFSVLAYEYLGISKQAEGILLQHGFTFSYVNESEVSRLFDKTLPETAKRYEEFRKRLFVRYGKKDPRQV